MAANVNEFDAWILLVPVLDTGDPEFGTWYLQVPVLDNAAIPSNIAGVGRPRVFIF